MIINQPLRIGRYEVQHKIGEGSFGVVYKARDPLLDRIVAIKVPAVDLKEDELANLVMEFYREARISAKFKHANIVTIYDVGADSIGNYSSTESQKIHYLVMEHVPGVTLHDYVKQLGVLSIDEALHIIFECCKALDYIHFHNITHRDIKLANILVNPIYSTVKIMDFGIADQVENRTGKLVGTLCYMSPEHFADKEQLTPKTDIFALGAVMYQLLGGYPPFMGDDKQTIIYGIMNSKPAPLTDIRPEISSELEAVVMKALEKKPENRYQTALEFADAIKQVMAHRVSEFKRLEDQHESIDLNKIEEYLLLRDHSWFKEFSPDLIDELVRSGEIETYAPGEYIVREGDRADDFYTVLSGSTDVTVGGQVINHMYAGECFGELSQTASDKKRTASVLAKELTKVLRINMTTVDQLSPVNQVALYKAFLKVTTQRLSDRSNEIALMKKHEVTP